jgi:hypothetical protein
MPKRKVKLMLNTYRIVEEQVHVGIRFAMNRLEDHEVTITEEQRKAAEDSMVNEIMVALDEVVDWE